MAKGSKTPRSNSFDELETRRTWSTGQSTHNKGKGEKRVISKHDKGRTSPIAKKKKKGKR